MKNPLSETIQKMQGMQKTLLEPAMKLSRKQQEILDSSVKYAVESAMFKIPTVSGWVADLKAQTVSELGSLKAQTASKWAGFNLPNISELASVNPVAALKLPDFKMPPTIIEHFGVSKAMGVPAATAASDYLHSLTQTLRENHLVHTFNSSLVNLNDLTRYPDVTEQLLRPLSYFEEQAKAMNVAALGYDAVHLTAFSAILAVTEQFKFFQTNIGVRDLFPNVPLYQLLTDLAELEPEEFETEEGEWKAVVEKIEEFLKTLLENAKEYPSNLVNYFGQANLILFILSVLLSFYLSSQSVSPEDVQDVKHQAEEVDHKVEGLQRDLEQQARAEVERQKRLEEKIDRLTAMLEKWSKELSKQQQSLPSAGKSTLYMVTENIEIYSDSSLDSPALAALSVDEPVMVLRESDEWMQVQFFDYLFGELKTGWTQKSYLAPLNSSDSEADHTTISTNNNESPPSFIQRTPGVCGGNARVRNTRIPVWTLVAFRQEGMTDEELLYNYPSLTPKDLEATWAYYQAHQSEIDQAIADQDED